MKFFLTEELTSDIWRESGSLAETADRCWALKVYDGQAALRALDDSRWCRETVDQMESVEAGLGRWASVLACRQQSDGVPLAQKEQALLAYGVEARLWPAAMAESCLQRILEESGCKMGEVKLSLLTSNPYLRAWLGRLRPRLAASDCRRLPGSWPAVQALREMAAGWPMLRSLARAGAGRGPALAPSDRVIAAFILNQRYLDLFQPIREELETSGWTVPVYYYNPLVWPCSGAVSFAEAVRQVPAAGCSERFDPPSWLISDEMMARCPVSQIWLTRALDASWVTGRVLSASHERLLASLRPQVVVSFGPETMSLSLQTSAEKLGIPSLFVNHTFREPARSCWFLQATASTMAGPDCLEANRKDLDGRVRAGMVATGHPPYDVLLKHSLRREVRALPGLSLPAGCRYVVVALALWSNNLLWHGMQRKTLRMLAEALPADTFLVCKAHPSMEDREFCEKELAAKLPRETYRVVGEREYRTLDLLAACDVAVIHEPSMSVNDAVVMGCPTIAVSHPEFPYGRYTMNHPAWGYKGAWRVVSDTTDLRQALLSLTRDPAARAELLSHRRAYIERFLVAADGASSRRVAELVQHLAEGKGPGAYRPFVGPSLLGEA